MEKLSYSLEDYIEEIYVQIRKNGYAKVTEIANSLNVKKSSVTGALNILSEKNLVNYIPYSPITLTREGEEIAKSIFEKHNLIARFFIKTLNIEEKEAIKVACAMEHIISDDFLRSVKTYIENSQ